MAILSEESKIRGSQPTWQMFKVFDDTTTDETTSDAIAAQNAEAISLIVESAAGVSGGVVRLEGAVTEDYSGTWINLGSITTSAGSTAYGVSNNIALATGMPIKYVRARVETVISGGGSPSVDAYIIVQR